MNVLETRGDIFQNFDGVVSLRIPSSTAVQPGADGQDNNNDGISHDIDKEEEPLYSPC
jgi:hypothetical protein